MDDVDAVQAQIARNMLASGDWVTARLDGIAYLEKPPLVYWMIAVAYRIFGVHDWAARLPLALGVVLLCWVTYRFAGWAFDEETGLYVGIVLSTSAGLFLFTRILIPDAILTLAITGAIWAWLRLLEPEGEPPLRGSIALGICLGIGLLLKGLIAVVFPVMAGFVYMAITRQVFSFCGVAPPQDWTDCSDCLGYRRPLAPAGNFSQSSPLCVLPAQWAGRIPRILLVLLLQRAHFAFPEPEIPT
jgi:4-amino-4-deoxy-L-arabinose transferase-like glycosyltransferase